MSPSAIASISDSDFLALALGSDQQRPKEDEVIPINPARNGINSRFQGATKNYYGKTDPGNLDSRHWNTGGTNLGGTTMREAHLKVDGGTRSVLGKALRDARSRNELWHKIGAPPTSSCRGDAIRHAVFREQQCKLAIESFDQMPLLAP
ncbi:hypothetical protein AYO20_01912 [Fonsecaea nubica]|uniref:Uncharacterized protein n=1 Tax=Fonsecaea nubica TaxID=856822 RepID=A0A178DAC9_9EURO|nr:hypothetical protein AYO20_01912 [Fonsecaea nubica]OAL38706.1 hypothetical protein AYO20_01912 [Fonsecaea nubica]